MLKFGVYWRIYLKCQLIPSKKRWLFLIHMFSNCIEMSQDATLQHYMDYTVESLTPVMAYIAKNVVKVNEGQTKHMVSRSLHELS